MRGRIGGIWWIAALAMAGSTWAQTTTRGVSAGSGSTGTVRWRRQDDRSRTEVVKTASPRTTANMPRGIRPGVVPAAATAPVRRPIARVTKGTGTLPNDQGQVWREYDISPYTSRVTNTKEPEQAIIDWILRETGYEAWHSQPLGLLSASKQTLTVYHTPEIQAIVAAIVDRFVSSSAAAQAFRLRVVTVGSPNWRARALQLMTPVPVQSPGVQAWLLAKENAALLLAELRKRSDCRQHGAPQMLTTNGQSLVVSTVRPRTYVRGIVQTRAAWPGYNPDVAKIDEGYSLQFSPLLSLDGKAIDAVIKLRLSQIEEMVPVMLDVPSAVAPRQRVRIEVPQMITYNMHERFRWPADQVLLLSLGVVATPDLRRGNALTNALLLPGAPGRADALLFIEQEVVGGSLPAVAPVARTRTTHPSGRY